MAITKSLTTSVDLDTSTLTITDASTYTSPSRATCGVFLKVFKVDSTGSRTDLQATSSGDPNTDSVWTCNFEGDGWYKYFYVAVPDWAVTTYNIYDAVFNPLTNIVYRSKVGSNSVATASDLLVTANWEVITDPAELAIQLGTITQSVNLITLASIGVFNDILYPNTKRNFGAQASLAFLEHASSYKRPQDVRLYNLLGIAVDGMQIALDREEYSLGEIIARRATSICSSCE